MSLKTQPMNSTALRNTVDEFLASDRGVSESINVNHLTGRSPLGAVAALNAKSRQHGFDIMGAANINAPKDKTTPAAAAGADAHKKQDRPPSHDMRTQQQAQEKQAHQRRTPQPHAQLHLGPPPA